MHENVNIFLQVIIVQLSYHSKTKRSTIIVYNNANKDMYMLIKGNLQHNKFKGNKM